MIQINKLIFNNIGLFKTEQVIDFSETGDIVRFIGKKAISGGSSGAGKSTVFKAIMYVFKVSESPATVLQSRLTKSPMYATLYLQSNGEELKVTRHKKNGLTIEFPNSEKEPIEGNSSIAEEYLDSVIGMSRDMFRKILLKRQKEGGFFLNMTSKEMFKFVSDILGVSEENKKADIITKDINDKKSRLSYLNETMAEKVDELSVCKKALSDEEGVEICVEKYTEEEIDSSVKRSKDIEKELSCINKTIADEQARVIKPEAVQAEEYDSDNLNKFIAERSGLKNELSALKQKLKEKSKAIAEKISEIRSSVNEIENHTKKELMSLVSDLKSLQDTLKVLNENTCPVCEQSWKNGKQKRSISGTISDIDNKKIKIGELTNKVKELPSLNEQCLRLKEAEKTVLSKIDDVDVLFSDKIQELNSKISKEEFNINNVKEAARQANIELENKYTSEINKISENHLTNTASLNKELNDVFNKISKMKEINLQSELKIAQHSNTLKSLRQSVKEKGSKLKESESKVNKISKDIDIAEDAKRAVKKYVLSVFSDFLDTIGEKASEILSNVPNMANAHIIFDGCKETKSGVLKDEITPIITHGSDVGIPIKSLSGGERTSADLAVDFAVIQTIEEFKNVGVNMYIMDEPFEGLDSVCKESYTDIITSLDINKKIIIVDHSSELNEMIGDVVIIENNGEESIVL